MSQLLARRLQRAGKLSLNMDEKTGGTSTADEDPRVEYLRIVIRNLRQKLEAPEPVGSVIANELGVGYRLRADP